MQHSFEASWTEMPQCSQYIQAEMNSPTSFLRQIVASYILQRGVFDLIISSLVTWMLLLCIGVL
jgi:hypothetical protein